MLAMTLDGVAAPAVAQSAGTAQGNGDVLLDEITITSQKRAEPLARAPAAVTVIPGPLIEQDRIDSLDRLARQVPGVTFADTGTRAGNTYLTIRGFRNNDRSLDPAAAFYLDGVPFGDFLSQNQRLFDVERIEVLRGPQGVLYGVNSQAGVINVVSRPPSMDAYSGYAGTSVDSRVGLSANFGLTGPLVPGFAAFSLAGVVARSDGQFTNLATAQDYARGHDDALRARLRVTPTENWTVDLGIYRSRAYDRTGYIYAPVNRGSYAANAFVAPFTFGPFDATANAGSGKLETDTQSASARYTGEWFDLNAVVAFRQARSRASFDFDLSPRNFLVANQDYKAREQYYEVRLESPSRGADGPLQWLAGVSHNVRDSSFDRPLDVFAGNPFRLPAGRADFSGRADLTSVNTGVFGQGTYRVLDQRLGFTVGLRYDAAERDIDRASFGGGIPGLRASRDEGQLLPKFGIDYRVGDATLLYATVQQGWKAGGVSPYAPTIGTSFFRRETSWSYEAGVRSRIAPTLSVSAAGYWNEIRDFQDEIRPNLAQVYLGNAARASTRGIEVEAQWQPTEAWEFRALLGFVRATYDDYVYDQASGFRLDGKAIRQVPDYNYTLAARYRFAPDGPAAGWWVQGELTGLGPYSEYNYSPQTRDLRSFEISGATLLSARIGYEGRNWSAQAFVTNITDERYFTNTINGAGFIGYREPLGILGERRTFGGQVKLRF